MGGGGAAAAGCRKPKKKLKAGLDASRGSGASPEFALDAAIPEGLDRMSKDRLAQLAADLQSKYSDDWLKDALSRPGDGWRALAGSVAANSAGLYEHAVELARDSEARFLASGNEAGALRAKSERFYGLQRKFSYSDCMSLGRDILDRVAHKRYPWMEIQAKLGLSSCSNGAGRAGEALEQAARAYDRAAGAGYVGLRLRALAFVTSLKIDLGDPEQAWAPMLEGLAEYWTTPVASNRGQFLLLNLVAAAEREGAKQSAYALRKEAAAVIASSQNAAQLATAHAKLGSAALVVGEPAAAASEFGIAERLYSQLPPKESLAARMDAMLSESASLAAAGQLAESRTSLGRIEAQGGKMPTELLEERFHTTQGLVLRASGDLAGSERELEAGVALAGQRIAVKGDREPPGSASPHMELASLLAKRGDWRRALEVWEMGRSGRPLPAVRLGETVAVYAPLRDGLACWTLRNDRVEGAWIRASISRVRSEADSFYRDCALPSPDRAHLEEAARTLYQWLLGPVLQGDAVGRTLVVEAPDFLSRIPFAALQDANGRVAGEDFSFALVDNLHEYAVRAERSRKAWTASDSAAVVADPALSPALRALYPPLIQAASEAAAVARIFPSARQVEPANATAEVILREGSRARLFHFAGHGAIRAGAGALLAAPPGPELFTGSMLVKSDWSKCDLAVLSACLTGAAPDGADASRTLAESLMRAGAGRVIASLWKIDSAATAALMQDFYASLPGQKSVSEAWRRAAAQARNRFWQPYYWAGFTVFGGS